MGCGGAREACRERICAIEKEDGRVDEERGGT